MAGLTVDSVAQVFHLFDKYGEGDYIGERVSQLQHAVQCAMLAEKDGYPAETILGALFHDIGHLAGQERGWPHMTTDGKVLGVERHEEVGEMYLQELGFPDSVSCFSRGHVDAKRYLTYKDDNYRKNLSPASTMTLVHQGGPMTEKEAKEFEQNPNFRAILRMRQWDEQAKDPNVAIESLEKYKKMCQEVLKVK